MQLKLQNSVDAEKVKDYLEGEMPNCTVKTLWISKKTVVVQQGTKMIRVVVKDGVAKIKGEVNTQNPGVAIGMVLGVFAGLIGMLIVWGIVWLVKKKDIKELQAVVYEKLEDGLGLVSEMSHKEAIA